MIPPQLLNQIITVRRRTSTGNDSLGNPIYGSPTDGAGWNIVYQNMPVAFAFNTKQVRFAPEGERILPTGVVYYNAGYEVKQEDRIITEDGIEYNVIAVSKGTQGGNVVSHYEAVVQLP